MRAVSPRTGVPEETLTENQLEFMTPTVARYIVPPNDTPASLTRWKFSRKEKEQVANGKDLFILIQTPKGQFPPISIQMGMKGLEVKET